MRGADDVFKALADPSRGQVLDLLCAKNGQMLGALCEQLDRRRQSASQHLDTLLSARLDTAVWRGRARFHFINPVPIHEIYERWVKKFERRGCAFCTTSKPSLKEDTINDTKFSYVTYITSTVETVWEAFFKAPMFPVCQGERRWAADFADQWAGAGAEADLDLAAVGLSWLMITPMEFAARSSSATRRECRSVATGEPV